MACNAWNHPKDCQCQFRAGTRTPGRQSVPLGRGRPTPLIFARPIRLVKNAEQSSFSLSLKMEVEHFLTDLVVLGRVTVA